ncbi:uncharacterized protein C5orf47 homolog [Oenanthe melanoleuca]|uniref:uncharacterized protein C5orf47 homolog n=1 Tax=Oenanthe melanoleuca TaxID=2939378 RepID=UPI0024C158AA|nr:uncharacterized protein C5orf47 homolog [Oenanthe melanoleuca]
MPAAPPQRERGHCARPPVPPVPLVYVNSFGSHRCGTVIRLGRGCRQSPPGQGTVIRRDCRQSPPGRGTVIRLGRGCRQSPPGQGTVIRLGRGCRQSPPGLAGPSAGPGSSGRRAGSGGERRAGSRSSSGDPQEAKADTFDFPIPSRNADKVIKRKKKKSKVWHKVWKVISKMLEENERFRSRLLTCSQFNGEGSDRIQRSQNGAYLDRDESIFGWV